MGGLLAGTVGAGAMLAITMSNAGGAWDNSKKYIEIAGAHGGKGTDIHAACVIDDSVGDPFKDTSGPALNILLKLMSVVSLVIAIYWTGYSDYEVWYFSFIPLFLMAVGTWAVIKFNYMSREDPLETKSAAPAAAPAVEMTEGNPICDQDQI